MLYLAKFATLVIGNPIGLASIKSFVQNLRDPDYLLLERSERFQSLSTKNKLPK